MPDIFLPTLHTFENNNIFTGSCGNMRFRIQPQVVMATSKEVNSEASSMFAEIWYGEKCYELSEMQENATFIMTEAGRAELKAWLESHA